VKKLITEATTSNKLSAKITGLECEEEYLKQ